MAKTESSRSRLILRRLLIGAAALVVGGAAAFAIDQIKISDQKPPIVKSVKPEKRRIWCDFDPKADGIIVSVEKATKTKGASLTDSYIIPSSSVFSGSKPLAAQCHEDGTLWWLNDKQIYRHTITPTPSGCCDVELNQAFPHTSSFPEYAAPGAGVIAAAMWWPANQPSPSVAEVSKNGLLQIFKPPTDQPDIAEHFLLELSAIFKNEESWPRDLSRVVLGVTGHDGFSIIPLDHPAQTAAQNADSSSPSPPNNIVFRYYFQWSGGSYSGEKRIRPWVLNLRELEPDAKTTIAAEEIVFNPIRGGWVTNLTFLTNDGRIRQRDVNVVPLDVSTKGQPKDMSSSD
ncbi:hypothetical protein HY988_06345 [Candidatus Micrarchaeota archaeon]|nr:hypothetical protein [Candidatus Micrarchaeota archaeon]